MSNREGEFMYRILKTTLFLFILFSATDLLAFAKEMMFVGKNKIYRTPQALNQPVNQTPAYKACPKRINKTIAKRLITYWMQAEMWGQTRSSIAKTRCLQRKTQYKVVLPGPPTDIAKKPVPVFASGWKLLSLKKLQETKFSTDYIARIQVKATSARKPASFSQKVLFAFPKGMEAKLFGCVMLHSNWQKHFIQRQCYQR